MVGRTRTEGTREYVSTGATGRANCGKRRNHRDVTHAPIVGSVVGDGSGDGIRLVYHVAAA